MAHELELDLQHILQHTSTVWPKLAGANILLTGPSGFVGRWLVESFLYANARLQWGSRLYVLTRKAQAFAHTPGLEILVGDLKTFPFPPVAFHYVIHAAMEHESSALDAKSTIAANLQGVDQILQLATRAATRKILFTSSGAVYGQQPVHLPALPETYIRNPRTADSYALSKCESENRFAQSATPVVITRLFAFVGAYLPLDLNFAVGNFVRDALNGGPIRIEGDGTPLRSYLYAADLAIWLWTLLVNGEPSRTYNVGSDQAISIKDLADQVEQICGVTSGISIAKNPVPGALPMRYIPAIGRARSEQNLQPLIPLNEGILRMFEWAKRRYTSTK